MLTTDFQTNKKIIEEITIIGSKRLRNKISGFATHLMKRIQKGSIVRGISLKLQELEKEKRFDFVPEVSYVDATISSGIHVDESTQSMLDSIGFGKIAGLHQKSRKGAA
jgi:small subunit ribosomal protein S17e